MKIYSKDPKTTLKDADIIVLLDSDNVKEGFPDVSWITLSDFKTEILPDLSGYEKTENKDEPNGYAGLDSDGLLNIEEIPELSDYEKTANKNQQNGYAGLGSDGKISSSQLPAIAITNTFVVDSEANMLLLEADTGDVAVRTDINTTFILQGTDPTQLSDWVELLIRTIDQYNTINIPIEFPEDGDVPPSVAELYTNGNKKVRIRKFSNSANNDLSFDWATPCDMDTTKTIQFRVKGIKTEPNGEEGSETWTVKFTLSGYSSSDLTSSDGIFGTAQSVTKDIGNITIPQHNVFITEWSPNITVSGISSDTINQFKFLRDVSVVNNYIHDIGVLEIEIRYTKKQF